MVGGYVDDCVSWKNGKRNRCIVTKIAGDDRAINRRHYIKAIETMINSKDDTMRGGGSITIMAN